MLILDLLSIDIVEPGAEFLSQQQAALLHGNEYSQSLVENLVTVRGLYEAEDVACELALLPVIQALADLKGTDA